jgi:hypothetical protein
VILGLDSSSFDQFVRSYSGTIGIAITVGLLALLVIRMLAQEGGASFSPALGHLLDGSITFILIVFIAIVAVRFHVLA